MNTENNKPPYVGPRTFEPEERDRFFGREREARELFARVISERLVLFYAQSGAGKSSLVNTCLIPDLKAKKFVVFPVGRVGGEALPGTEVQNIFVFNLINRLTKSAVKQDGLAKLSITKLITKLTNLAPSEPQGDEEDQVTRPHVLIIDQFEELFSTHAEAWTKREDFFQQLAQAMEDHPYLRVVLVMREDYIASLDPYAHLLPGRLGRRYYMQRLEREAAIKAVRGPVEKLRPFAPGVAEQLVNDLSSIKIQNPDGTQGLQPGQYVEPVQLQVVCHSLWNNLTPGGTSITDRDLSTVGDVDDALGKYYAQRVAGVAQKKKVRERLIRDWIETKLIASGGIRSMVLRETSSKSDGMRDDVIQELQSDLVRAENRGGAIWYELTHDRLVVPIQENNKKWFDENLSALQRQAALWNAQNEQESWLLIDQALVDVEDWARANPDEMGELEIKFLNACRRLQAQIDERNQARERQLEIEKRSALIARRITTVALGFLLLAIVATLYAFSQGKVAEEERNKAVEAKNIAVTAQAEAKRQADISRAGELAALALSLADSRLDPAMLLGVEANSLARNPQIHNALLTLAQRSGRYLGSIDGAEEIKQIEYAPNGKTFASLDTNGITIWDANTRKTLNQTPLNGHFAGVITLALSRDAKMMASGASNGTIALWDAVERQQLGELIPAQEDEMGSLALSPDGKTLAWGKSDNSIVLWNVEEGRPIDPPLQGHEGWINFLAFSPDGRILASASDDPSIILWDVENGQPLGEPLLGHSESVFSLAFSPNGEILASGSYDDTIILWDVREVQNPQRIGEPLTGHTVDIEVVAISPDGKLLASGDDNGDIFLWDIQKGEALGEPLNGGTSWIVSLAFSPDGKTLAAGSIDGLLILWDVERRIQIGEALFEHDNSIWGVAFSQDGRTLVSASEDSEIIFWDVSEVETPQMIGSPLQGHPGQPTSIAYSPDGSLLASYGDDGTFLFEVQSQEPLGPGELMTIPNKKLWAYQILDQETGESTIHLRDAATGDPIGPPILGQNPIFSADGNTLAFEVVNEETSELHLWDVARNQELDSPRIGDFVGFSPDSRILIHQRTDEETEQTFFSLWEIASSKNIGEEIAGSYVTLNPDTQTLVYQIDDSETGRNSIIFWDLAAGSEVSRISDISLESSYLEPNQSGTVLTFVEYDTDSGRETLNLLETATGEPISEPIEGVNIGGSSVNRKVLFYYSFDNDGRPQFNAWDTELKRPLVEASPGYLQAFYESDQVIAYGIYDYNEATSNIRLINATSGQEIITFKGNLLNLIEDGEILVYEDNGIHLFDISEGAPIGEPVKGTYLSMSPDGKTLITSAGSNTITFWDITNTWLLGQHIAGNSHDISSAALSLDGRTLAFAQADLLALQDLATGNVTGTFPNEHVGGVTKVVLSPDKQTLLSTGEEGNTIAWDLNSSEPISEAIPGTSAVFSPDGTRFAVGDGANPITIWNLTTGTQQTLDDVPLGRPVMFSPDGSALAIEGETSTTLFDLVSNETIGEPIQGSILYSQQAPDIFMVEDSSENTTIIWDWESKSAIEQLAGSESVLVGEDFPVLVVQDPANNTTTLWNTATREQLGDTLTGIYEPVLSPDGTLISAADLESSTTYIWDLKTEIRIGSKQGYFRPVFCSDNNTVAYLSDGYITLADKIGENPSEEVIRGIHIVFSPDCGRAVIIDDSRSALLWDFENGRALADLGEGDNAVFSVDSSKVAVADSSFGTTTFWNVNDREPFGDQAPAGNIPYTPATGDVVPIYDVFSGLTTLWNVNTGTQIGHETYFEDFSPIFDADGRLIAYNNNGITLWDTKSNKIVGQPLRGHVAPVTNMLFSPNGRLLASLATDGIVLSSLDAQSSTYLETGDSFYDLNQMVFSPDGLSLTALASDGTILTWNTGRDPASLRGSLDAPYKDSVENLYLSVLSPDGKYLAYATEDKLTLWNIDEKKAVQEVNVNNLVNAISFSPDGQSMFYNDGSRIFRWDEQSSGTAGGAPFELFSAGQNLVWSIAVVMGDSAPQYLVVTSYGSTDQFGAPADPNTQIWELTRNSRIGDPLSGYEKAIDPNAQPHLLVYLDNNGRLIRSFLDSYSLASQLCNKAGRNFTRAEWEQYFPDEKTYQRTCGKWPLEPEVIGSQGQ